MDKKIKALCVRAEDYKENDKVLTLISQDRGKIVASAKSVRSINSKLKMSCSPLCYGEFIFAEKNGRMTIIGCSIINNYLSCWKDINKYSASQIITETLDKIAEEDLPIEEELKIALIALTYIDNEETSPYIFSVWFLCRLYTLLGIELDKFSSIPDKYKKIIHSITAIEPEYLGSLEITSSNLYYLLSYLGSILNEDMSIKLHSIAEAIKMINLIDKE